MQNQDNRNEIYCFIDVRSQKDSIICICNCVIASLLMIYAGIGFYYMRRRSYRIRPIINYLVFAWGIIFIAEYTIAVCLQMRNGKIYKKENLSQDEISSIAIYSKINLVIDTFPAFIVQGLFIFIPFNIISNIFQLSTDKGYMITRRQLKFYQFLKVYQYLRVLGVLLVFTIFIPEYTEKTALDIISTAGSLFTATDALLCNLLLIIIYKIINNRPEVKQYMGKEQYNQLLRELLILNLACLVRFIIDIVIVNVFIKGCPKQMNINTYGYLLFGNLCMHFIPIFAILKQYSNPFESPYDQGLLEKSHEALNDQNHTIFTDQQRKQNLV